MKSKLVVPPQAYESPPEVPARVKGNFLARAIVGHA